MFGGACRGDDDDRRPTVRPYIDGEVESNDDVEMARLSPLPGHGTAFICATCAAWF